MKASQEMARCYSPQTKECKTLNSFDRFCFGRAFKGTLLIWGHLWKCTPEFSPPDIQRQLQPRSKGQAYCLSWWHTLESSLWCGSFRHAKYQTCGVMIASTQISEGLKGQIKMCDRVIVPSRSLWKVGAWSCESKAKGAVKVPGSWRCQECGVSAEKNCRQWTKPAQQRDHVDCHLQGHRGGAAQTPQSSYLTKPGLGARHRAIGFNGFQPCFGPIPSYSTFLRFGMGIFTLCQCMLELFNLFFHFYRGS